MTTRIHRAGVVLAVPVPSVGLVVHVQSEANAAGDVGSHHRSCRRGPGEFIVAAVDVETTGLDHRRHEVIDPGMVAFVRDAEGRICPVVGVLGMPDEPQGEMSAEIARLTGTTAEAVAAQAIDMVAVRALLEPADLVIAHDVDFDRASRERPDDAFRREAWACSIAEVPWRDIGFAGGDVLPKAWWTEVDEDDVGVRVLECHLYLPEMKLRRYTLAAFERYRPG